MYNKIINFFIPANRKKDPTELRKYKLVCGIVFITVLFDLNYVGITALINLKEGIYIMLITSVFHSILLFFVRKDVSVLIITNLYVAIGVISVIFCIYYSGGFY